MKLLERPKKRKEAAKQRARDSRQRKNTRADAQSPAQRNNDAVMPGAWAPNNANYYTGSNAAGHSQPPPLTNDYMHEGNPLLSSAAGSPTPAHSINDAETPGTPNSMS